MKILTNPIYSKSNYWMNVITIDNKKIKVSVDKIIHFMKKNLIETRKVWHLNHLQKPFKLFKYYNISKSIILQKNSICIPSSPTLNTNELNTVTNCLKRAIKFS
jgi:dTDP-4-amino-4,6-dideoxygalactose transaminase